MRKLVAIVLTMTLLVFLSSCQDKSIPKDDFTDLKGPYLGQTIPGNTPQIFAEEIVNKSINSIFSPDGTEFYFVNDSIRVMHFINGVWTKPRAASFNGSLKGFDLCMSYDGNQILFRSRAPLPDYENTEEHSYIWITERNGQSWSIPKPFKYKGNYLKGGYPSFAANGNIYLPMSDSAKGDNSNLFVLEFENGEYKSPRCLNNDHENLFMEGDMCVAPDESFVITSCWNRPDSAIGGESDLYISFRQESGQWSELIYMGKEINSDIVENCPTITPDSKYFIFFRYDKENSKTFWVDAKIIDELKPM